MKNNKTRAWGGWPAGLCLLFASSLSSANPSPEQVENLKRCLADWDGIEWALPYQPVLDIRACQAPLASYPYKAEAQGGVRKLDMIGPLMLGPADTSHLREGADRAALYEAVFRHFESLFVRRGYRQIHVEHGDARYRDNRLKNYLYSRGRELPPDKPPIPFIKKALFVRNEGGREIRLTYEVDMANTWLITMDGLPVNAGGVR